jgi:hypothetical protein
MAFQIAQVNVAQPRAPLDGELLREFVANLDPVNALADDAPGFVWRLQTEDGNDHRPTVAEAEDRLRHLRIRSTTARLHVRPAVPGA